MNMKWFISLEPCTMPAEGVDRSQCFDEDRRKEHSLSCTLLPQCFSTPQILLPCDTGPVSNICRLVPLFDIHAFKPQLLSVQHGNMGRRRRGYGRRKRESVSHVVTTACESVTAESRTPMPGSKCARRSTGLSARALKLLSDLFTIAPSACLPNPLHPSVFAPYLVLALVRGR